MKLLLIPCLSLFVITSCMPGNEVADKARNSQTTEDLLKDSEASVNDSIRKYLEQGDEDQPFWSSSYMRLDNFLFLTGYSPMDQLKDEFDKDPQTKISNRDMEGGDCNFSIRSMSRGKQEILHYLKGDCGEYGFSNAQYYLKNDSLKMIREFSVNIDTWPDEQHGSTWKVSETIHVFGKHKVQVQTRESVIGSDLLKTVLSIRKKPFTDKIVAAGPIYEAKQKEMISDLKLEPRE